MLISEYDSTADFDVLRKIWRGYEFEVPKMIQDKWGIEHSS